MRRFIISAMLALSLSGCGVMQALTGGPRAVADRTVFDEAGFVAVAGVVETAADLLTVGVESGIIKDSDLPTVRAGSLKMRSLLKAAQAAYAAGNSAKYDAAVAEIMITVSHLRNLAKGVPGQ